MTLLRLLSGFLRRWILCFGGLCSVGLMARAELQVTPAQIDLGRRRMDQTVESSVKLTNVGPAVEQIVRVGADCSCTAATPGKTTLQPGESTEMKVSFETHHSQGEVHRRISVLTAKGEITIPLRAVVSAYDDWEFSGAMAMLPPSNKGQSDQAEFTLTYTGPGAAEIERVSSDAEWLKAEIGAHRDRIWTLKLTKSADAPAGNLQPKLIAHTTDKHEPSLEIPVFASVYSVLRVQPNPIVLPSVKVGQVTSMPVTIAGWEPKEDPRGEITGGRFLLQQRDHGDALMTIAVTPEKAGTSTRLLRIYNAKGLEAEVPVIIRAEP